MSNPSVDITLSESGTWYSCPVSTVRVLTDLLNTSTPKTTEGLPIYAIKISTPCGEIIWDQVLKMWRP